jgi:hypothetical protein
MASQMPQGPPFPKLLLLVVDVVSSFDGEAGEDLPNLPEEVHG